jgi:hypothetical protein
MGSSVGECKAKKHNQEGKKFKSQSTLYMYENVIMKTSFYIIQKKNVNRRLARLEDNNRGSCHTPPATAPHKHTLYSSNLGCTT